MGFEEALRALVLGIVQGATEFLPVSSSGHLVLLPWLLGWPEPGLVFDAVVHWATALAVVAYFWRDWLALLSGAWRDVWVIARSGARWDQPTPISAETRLLAWIVLGTLPAAVAGVLLEDFFEAMFSRPTAVACFLLLTAALLVLSEVLSSRRNGGRTRDLKALTWLDVLVVGIGQALAIFPGLSRSGTTISAGLARGLRRDEAARFSFLLATPVILGAGLVKVVDLVQAGGLAAQAPVLALGFVAAGVVGLACIHLLMRLVRRRPLYPFAAYCALAGAVCLLIALVRGG
jgi:undecaprenyl-diphosphatase